MQGGEGSCPAPALLLIRVQLSTDLALRGRREMFGVRKKLQGRVDERHGLPPPVVCLLLVVQPEDTELNTGVFHPCARQQQSAPQFVIHRPVVVPVQAACLKRQLSREEHFRLDQMTAFAAPPHRADAHEILERADTATMRVENTIARIDMDAVAYV